MPFPHVCIMYLNLCKNATTSDYISRVHRISLVLFHILFCVALELDSVQGIIPARSRCLVQATVRPRHRMNYTFNVSYELCMPELNRDELTTVKGGRKPLCEIRGIGVYPTLQVTDARCYGSASGISKSRLWKLFSLDK